MYLMLGPEGIHGTHRSHVVLIVGLVFFHNAGEAAGVGGGAGKVLSLWDGWRPATHDQATRPTSLGPFI